MQVRIASACDAGPTSEQIGKDLAWCQAAQQIRPQIAMHRRDDIVRTERVRRADGNRFVTALTERAAHTTALLPVREHPLVERPCELHPVVDGELLIDRHSQ